MENNIHNAVRILAGTNKASVYSFDAEVTSAVNEDLRTVEVTMVGGESSNTLDVRLMSSVDDGALFYPKLNSTVTVLMTDYMNPIIIGYSEIEKIVWLGGEHGGVPIAIYPNDESKGLLAKINALENLLNDLISNYNGHTHKYLAGPGPVVDTAITLSPETSNIAPITALEDIVHPNITH